MKTIAFQTEFRPALPVVFGAKDYREFRTTLEEMDQLLTVTGIEDRMIAQHLKSFAVAHPEKQFRQPSYKMLRQALRYNILLALTGLSYRALSQRVADSVLFQWFTHASEIDGVRPVSKSTIERFEKIFSNEEISQLIHDCNTAVADPASAKELLYSEVALDFDEIFADTTCVKSNIHYPVDWVLLRDATRTLIKAMNLIRSRGLKHRIVKPNEFRRMKKLMKKIEKHTCNHFRLLETRWMETDWSEVQTQVVLDRIQNILDQLPQTIHQAHERLIGERRVANKDKILSLYKTEKGQCNNKQPDSSSPNFGSEGVVRLKSSKKQKFSH